MKRLKKYILILIMSLITIFMLIGCDNVKISSSTDINIDGTTSTTLRLYYDDNINKLVENNLLSYVIEEVNKTSQDNMEFGEITKSKDGELNVEEVIVTTTNKVKINNLSAMSNEYVNVETNKDKALFLDTYKITISFKKNLVNEISNAINSNINSYKGTSLASLIGKNVANIVGEIPIDLVITMPVEIIESNAPEIINKKTIDYSYTISELNQNNNIMLSFKVPNVINISIAVILAIILIIVAIVYFKNRKKM